jgi:hypothetical protein
MPLKSRFACGSLNAGLLVVNRVMQGDAKHMHPTFRASKAVVPLVLPQAWVARINQLAVERGVNRSALIRAAIEATYFASPTPSAPRDAPEAAPKGGAA